MSDRSTAYRDLAVLSVGFLLCYTAYTGTSSLQTALHPRHALGSSSLALLYVACVSSVLVLAAPLVARCGPRRTLAGGAAALATYTLANMYPPMLYPAAVVAGLGLGPLWSAHGVQVALLARGHAERAGGTHEGVVANFFGIFFAVHRCSFVTGSLLSSLVLSAKVLQAGTATSGVDVPLLESRNVSTVRNVASCGSRFCHGVDVIPETNAYSAVTSSQEFALFGTYGVCALLGVVTLAFLSSSGEAGAGCRNYDAPPRGRTLRQSVLETIGRMRDPRDLLLLPMAFFSGTSYAFVTADFSLGFAACTLGLDQVGYVMASFGAAGALGSALCGPFVRWTGRVAIFVAGSVVTAAALVGMLLWTPSNDLHAIYLYVFAALWGLANIVWTSQLLALVGFVFRDERSPAAAFACNYLWQMLGSCAWYASGSALCLDQQLYVLAALLVLTLAGYAGLEFMIRTGRGRPTPPSLSSWDVMATDISLLDAGDAARGEEERGEPSPLTMDDDRFTFADFNEESGDIYWRSGQTTSVLFSVPDG